jgi:tetratricopeptide (TPR) repeat protein
MFSRTRVVLILPALLVALTQVAQGRARPRKLPRASAPPAEADAAAPPRPADTAEAAAHYRTGVERYADGDYEDAVVEFKLAYAKGGPPALLFNIAQAQRAGGHDQEALAYYKEYLRLVPDAPNRADVEERMATIEAELQAASHAERGIVTPAASTTIADSGKGGVDKIATRDDGAMAVDLRARPPVSSSMIEYTPTPYHPGRRLKWSGAALIGTGALSLGLGIYFGVSAGDAAGELDARAAQGLPWTDAEQRLYDRGNRDETLGVSLVLVGGAALATGAVLSYMGWEQDEQASEFALAPTPGGAQAVMAWGF